MPPVQPRLQGTLRRAAGATTADGGTNSWGLPPVISEAAVPRAKAAEQCRARVASTTETVGANATGGRRMADRPTLQWVRAAQNFAVW